MEIYLDLLRRVMADGINMLILHLFFYNLNPFL